MVPHTDALRGLWWRESPCKAWASCLCFHQVWAYTFSGQWGSLETTGVTGGEELKSWKPFESKSPQSHLYRAFLSSSPLFAQPHGQKRQGLEEVLPPSFSDFMPRPQTLTLFFWQGSHLLHEDQAESRQSRGCGRLLTDRAHLPLAMLLLVPLRLRDSFSPLHSTTQELQGVKPPSYEDRAIWPIPVQNYMAKRTNAC